MNDIVIKRLKALFIDWLCISCYLVVLGVITISIYYIIWSMVPHFNEVQSQLIATFTSIVPIILWFTIMEARAPYGSIGKRKMGLKISYQKSPWISSLLRNITKFLPWQLAHIGVINGIYSNFESPISIILNIVSMLLVILFVVQVVLSKNHRHLGDMIVNASLNESN